MIPLLLLALAQQPVTTTFPRPPGPTATDFAHTVAIEGNVALISMAQPSATIWMYERQGTSWLPTQELPAGILSGLLDNERGDDFYFDGQRLVTHSPAVEWEFDAGTWVQTQTLPMDQVRDVDLGHGTLIGRQFQPRETIVMERHLGDWQTVWIGNMIDLGIHLDLEFAIHDGVAAVGDATWFECHHFAWDGAIGVIERTSPGTTTSPPVWGNVTQIQETACQETLFGRHVEIYDGQIFATYQPAWMTEDTEIRVFERDAAGAWTVVQTIERDPGSDEISSGQRVDHGVLLIPASGWGNWGSNTYRYTRAASGLWERVSTDHLEGFTLLGDGNSAAPISGNRYAFGTYTIGGAAGGRVGTFYCATDDLTDEDVLAILEPVVSGPTCAGAPTSSGSPAQLGLVGSFWAGDERLTFSAHGLPSQALMLPIFSTSFGFVPNPAGSPGDLCVGQPFVRMMNQAANSNSSGQFQFQVDLNQAPVGPVSPGTSLHFQLWFRDPPNVNFTNGAVVRMN